MRDVIAIGLIAVQLYERGVSGCCRCAAASGLRAFGLLTVWISSRLCFISDCVLRYTRRTRPGEQVNALARNVHV